jgi:ribonuclease HI
MKTLSQAPEHGVVLYIDGGANPNPGNGGYGIHGYFYNATEQTELVKTTVLDHYSTTKGYALKVKKSDTDVLVEIGMYVDASYAMAGISTNNSAELSALLAAYRIAYDLYCKVNLSDEPKTLCIIADSKYTLDCATQWIHNWQKNGWRKRDGTPIANLELVQGIYEYQKLLKQQHGFIDISYKHVNSHVGIMGNEQADALATIGTRSSLDLQNSQSPEFNTDLGFTTYSVPKNYWKNSVERNPYVDKKRIFFNTYKEYIDEGCYYQSDSGGSDFIHGKRISEAGYSFLKLKEPDQVLELIRERACEFSQGVISISMLHVDQIYNKKVHNDIMRYGKACLTPKTHINNMGQKLFNVSYVDKVNLATEANPTALTMRCIDAFGVLEETLEMYVQRNNPEHKKLPGFMTTDVTDYFYDTVPNPNKKAENKFLKVLKKDFESGKTRFNFKHSGTYENVEYTAKFPIVLGLDILPRNNLKKIEEDNPVVTLVSWMDSATALRYAFVIESDKALGIWSNYFADRVLLIGTF